MALLPEVDPGPGDGMRSVHDLRGVASEMVAVGRRVYFTAEDGAGGIALWALNTTTARMRMIRSFGDVQADLPSNLVRVGQRVAFVQMSGEVWISDGTREGTRMIRRRRDFDDMFAIRGRLVVNSLNGVSLVDPAGSSSRKLARFGRSAITSIGPLGDSSAVLVGTQDQGATLWAVGFGGGRRILTRLPDGYIGWGSATVGTTTYFGVERDGGEVELWRTDGTAAGTRSVRAFPPPWSRGSIQSMLTMGGRLYFVVYSSAGRELWRSDGTEAGTVRLAGADAAQVVRAGRRLFFTVDAHELWTSDGTVKGTRPLRTVKDGLVQLTPVREQVVLSTFRFSLGPVMSPPSRLWKSDGTVEGTVPVGAAFAGGRRGPFAFTTVIDEAYFFAARPATGREMWVVRPSVRDVP